jgi:hypothetical protein
MNPTKTVMMKTVVENTVVENTVRKTVVKTVEKEGSSDL